MFVLKHKLRLFNYNSKDENGRRCCYKADANMILYIVNKYFPHQTLFYTDNRPMCASEVMVYDDNKIIVIFSGSIDKLIWKSLYPKV